MTCTRWWAPCSHYTWHSSLATALGGLFTHEQYDGISRSVALFILLLFSFNLTAILKPYPFNLCLLAVDAVSKLRTLLILALWERFGSHANYDWWVTTNSSCMLTNLLVIDMPVTQVMYGQWIVNLVGQLCVLQSLVWIPLLFLLMEFRKMRMVDLACSSSPNEDNGVVDEERDIKDGFGQFSSSSTTWR